MTRDELVSEYVTINKELYKAWNKVFHAFAADKGLTPTLMAALIAVAEVPTATSHKIATKLRITDGAVTQLIDCLVRDGYVARSSDIQDRRVTNLVLTDDGQGKLADVKQKRRQLVLELTRKLSVDDLRLANEVNKKILQAIEQ